MNAPRPSFGTSWDLLVLVVLIIAVLLLSSRSTGRLLGGPDETENQP